MYVHELTRETSGDGECRVYPVGDMHADDQGFDEERFQKYITHIIEDPWSFCVIVGDLVNGTTPGHKHFEMDTLRREWQTNVDRYVTFSLDKVSDLLIPLVQAGVPTALVQGNHDRRMEWAGFSDAVARRLGFAYLGDGGFLRLKTGQTRPGGGSAFYSTSVFATHGSGGGKRPGGKINNMQQTMELVDADIIIKGHLHDANLRIVERLSVAKRGSCRFEVVPVALMRAASFLTPVHDYTNYAVRKEFGLLDRSLEYVYVNPRDKAIMKRCCDF